MPETGRKMDKDKLKADREYNSIKRTGNKLKAVKYKGGKCDKCGYKKNLAALDFHHIDPNEKEENFQNIIRRSKWEDIKKELDKCVLLCRNCHSEIHNPRLDLTHGDIKAILNNRLQNVVQKCPICGEDAFGKRFCSRKCAGIGSCHTKVKNRPTKNELKKMLKTMSFVEIGKKYGVSDVAVHYWLRGKRKRRSPSSSIGGVRLS
jgi:hypothetical protein